MTSDERLGELYEATHHAIRLIVDEMNEGSGFWNSFNKQILLGIHGHLVDAVQGIIDYSPKPQEAQRAEI